MNFKPIVEILLCSLCIAACVGSEGSSAPANTVNLAERNPLVVHSEEFRRFREEDKQKAHTFLDIHPIHEEKTGAVAVDNLKDAVSQIPSHILEGFKNVGGEIEFNSDRFTNNQILAKIDPSAPNRIVFNTHVNNRNFSSEQKDIAIFTILQQKQNLEYKKYAVPDSLDKNDIKKDILIASYRDFIAKVLADSNDTSNPSPRVAKDFFFGKNSPLHKFDDANKIKLEEIEENKEIIKQGIAKAITYHSAMSSSKGNAFLSTRFPHVNRTISELYFEPHGKSMPKNAVIPKVLLENLQKVEDSFAVSSSAFDQGAFKYISSERIGKYISVDPDISDPIIRDALKNLQSTQIPVNERVEKAYENGVGDCNIQSVVAAYLLRNTGIPADIYTLSGKGGYHSVVYAEMPNNEIFIVDPWAGLVTPISAYDEYYKDFGSRNKDIELNKILKDVSIAPHPEDVCILC
jgi:hypothetical protein